jgi:hypothetical protein
MTNSGERRKRRPGPSFPLPASGISNRVPSIEEMPSCCLTNSEESRTYEFACIVVAIHTSILLSDSFADNLIHGG